MKTNPGRLQALLLEARRRPKGPQREEFLDRAGAGDPELRSQLEALFRVHEDMPSSDQACAGPPGKQTMMLPLLEGPGSVIGRYRLLEKLGEGGFGVVYVAEQREPVKRRVALKIIKQGMDTRQVVARFEAERQALALMDHPDIAKVLDAGATETGRPYFVMELVKGIPITEYCDQQKLGTQERLNLFIQVCHAIQHAHQKGIIHRDIKPSNILVTLHDGVPVPKVIDFGIAKATQQELTDKTVYTQMRDFIGTPVYISPEQAEMSGLDVDTRADIYSLGVLLYELLTGQTPFEAKELLQAGVDGMRRILREKEPLRPSTRLKKMAEGELTSTAGRRGAQTPKLIKALQGDLDWVVMKCLEKDRTRRYETANAVATDLEHYLNNEAVAARPPSRIYRFQKLVRRHKLAFASLVAIVGALLLGFCLATFGFVEAMRAKAEESLQRQRAERESYYAGLALAKNYIDNGNMDLAEEALLACPVQNRNWEWGHCLYLCNQEILTLNGYTNGVSALAFNTNDTLLAILDGRGQVHVHELDDGRERNVGSPTAGWISVAFSPDGRLLALAAGDGDVDLFAAESGSALRALPGGGHRVMSLAFHPDGGKLATASVDGLIKLWNVETGKADFVVDSGLVQPIEVRFSRDGQRLIAKDTHDMIVLAAEGGQKLYSFQTAAGKSGASDVDESGDYFAGVNPEGEVSIWDAHSGAQHAQFNVAGQQIWHLFFTPGMPELGVVTADQTLRIWDINTREELFVTTYRVYGGSVSQDGRLFATFGGDNTAALWDRGGEHTPRLLKGHADIVQNLAISPSGRLIATASRDQTVKVWSSRPGRDLLNHGDWFMAAAFSPDSKRMVSAQWDRVATIWDMETGHKLHTLRGHHNMLCGVAFSPDGQRVATCGADRLAKIWDATTGRAALTLRGHTSGVTSVAFRPDGKQIATGSWDGTARLWDAQNGKEMLTLQVNTGGVWCVAFSPDGRQLATACVDGHARIWDVADGRLLHLLSSGSIWDWTLAYSAQGDRVATGGQDRLVRIWSLENGHVLHTLRCRAPIYSLAFTPDGKRLASITSDYTTDLGNPGTEIWDTESGRQVLNWSAHSGVTMAMALSPDGRKLFTAGTDDRGKVWESFPWHEADYPGTPDQPFRERVRVYAKNYWHQRLATEALTEPAVSQPPSDTIAAFDRADWPRRDEMTNPKVLDLSPYYNAMLGSPWEPFRSLPVPDLDLAGLPTGVVKLAGADFDVRGLIQLARNQADYRAWFPAHVSGILVNQKCRRLEFLHATTYTEDEGTPIGSYVLHYADGSTRELSILYGQDVRDWFLSGNEKADASAALVAWTGTNSFTLANHTVVRLFKRTWENPLPDEEITSFDFVSKLTKCGPFLVAVTLE